MKMFPTKFEIYGNDNQDLIASFVGFDNETMQVEIQDMILDPKELKQISDLFTIAHSQYTDGFDNE